MTDSPARRTRRGGLVVLPVLFGVPALAVGLVVAVTTRLDTANRALATLASVGTWAWVALLVALVLLGVAAAVGRSRVVASLAALALVGLVTQAIWLAPRFTGESTGGAAGPTVMTSNLKYGAADAASLVRTVRARGVDLLALEETTPAELTRLRAAGLEQVLPHVAGRPADDASGTMVFSSEPLTDQADVAVSRGGVGVTVQAQRPFRFLAVHLSDPLFHPARWYDDLGLLQRTARATSGPLVVAGDFNTTPDHAPFRRVLSRAGLRDGAEQAGSGLVPTWPGDRLVPFLTIDHVLTDRAFVVTTTARVHVPGTDHLALVAGLGERD